MSSNPSAARRSASGAVNASTPAKPGSSSRIRRRTGTERTDFEATRIGSPPACASIASLLRRSASRSTKANGGVTPEKIAS